MDVDVSVDSAPSFITWTTNVTKCTNLVFDNVLRASWTNSDLQKDILVVLAAITKTIQNKNGKESNDEYYAALVHTL